MRCTCARTPPQLKEQRDPVTRQEWAPGESFFTEGCCRHSRGRKCHTNTSDIQRFGARSRSPQGFPEKALGLCSSMEAGAGGCSEATAALAALPSTSAHASSCSSHRPNAEHEAGGCPSFALHYGTGTFALCARTHYTRLQPPRGVLTRQPFFNSPRKQIHSFFQETNVALKPFIFPLNFS